MQTGQPWLPTETSDVNREGENKMTVPCTARGKRAENGARMPEDKIWVLNRQASLSFRAGEHGRTSYRVYCILDCLGMEHLTNLLIEVV